ncbi:MAG: hypothetical protein HOP28_05435, partial [Gemmatimonadales bacterium]|nr:hypothetical protein [Gemmatimonadales bacterium]
PAAGAVRSDPKEEIRALHDGFARAAGMLASHHAVASHRYRAPWYLMVGDVAAGKSTLLAHSGLSQPFGDGDGAVQHPDCRWWFFDRGVVLDVAGTLALRSGAENTEPRRWKTLLRLLQRHRPERPLDGVIVAVSCADLLGTPAEARRGLVANATALRERLWESQNTFGLRLPVYVLVTKCDLVEGFTEFCAGLSPDVRADLFGWSSPHTLSTSFSEQWVTDGLAAMRERLYHAQLELLATRPPAPENDGVFVFPSRFAALADPLREYLGRLFHEVAYHDGSIFRGVYFTGDGGLEAAGPEEGRRPSPLFLRGLLTRKVFPEFGLAQPIRRSLLSANRTVLALQAAIVTIVLGGALGLWVTTSGLRIGSWHVIEGLRPQIMAIESALKVVDTTLAQEAADSQAGRDRGRRRTSGLALATAIARMPHHRPWSLTMPTSWLTPVLSSAVTGSLAVAFSEVTLPHLRRRFDARLNRMLRDSTSYDTRGCPSSYPEHPATFVGELNTLGRMTAVYNRVVTPIVPVDLVEQRGDIRRLRELLSYAYCTAIPEGFERVGYIGPALWDATAPPFDRTDWQPLALPAAARRLAAAAALVDSLLLDARPEAVGALRDFLRDADSVQALSRETDANFFFGADFATRLSDSVTLYLGNLLGRDPNARSIPTIRAALDSLLGQEFMAPRFQGGARAEVPVGEATWAVGPLEAAARLMARYAAYVEPAADSAVARFDLLPEHLREPVLAAVRAQVVDRVVGAVYESRASRRGAFGPIAETARNALRANLAAFDKAAPALERLIADLDGLDAAAERSLLLETAVADAEAMLEAAESLLSGDAAYDAIPTAFTASGGIEAEGIAAYLGRQREGVRAWTSVAAGVIGFLKRAGEEGVRVPSPLVTRWTGLLGTLERYDQKLPGTSLEALEAFARDSAPRLEVATCAARAAEGPASASDFFVQRRTAVRRALYARCTDAAGQLGATAYADVAAAFGATLAGRFPFSDPRRPAPRGDADPEAIRAFFERYDRVAPLLESTIHDVAAADFLRRLRESRAFFAPLLDSASQRTPAFFVELAFRTDRSNEQAANQIGGWSLRVGRERLDDTSMARRIRWRLGDSTRLSLRWAEGSPVRPLASGPGQVTTGKTITFLASGPWSLLRFLAGHASDREDGGETTLLDVAVSTVRAEGPAEEARVPIRVRLTSTDSLHPLRRPAFPWQSPPVPPRSSR